MQQIMTGDTRCRAFIALGGNLGDPLAAFYTARQQLQMRTDLSVTACSSLYRTAPVGGPPGQNDYLNAVLELATDLLPSELLDLCLELEQNAGRIRTRRWGPRTLDIDLLCVGGLVSNTEQLMLPHPRLHQRRFVLQPLCDVAPDWIHPRLLVTSADLLRSLPDTADVTLEQAIW